MKKYKLTTRGKILIVLLLALLLTPLIFWLSDINASPDDPDVQNLTSQTEPDALAPTAATDVEQALTAGQTGGALVNGSGAENSSQPTASEATPSAASQTAHQPTSQAEQPASSATLIDDHANSDYLKYHAATRFYYEANSEHISSDFTERLEAFVLTAQTFPKEKIAIDGYSVKQDNMLAAETRALRRAQYIKDYLLAAGIAAERISLSSQTLDAAALTSQEEARYQKVELYFVNYADNVK